MTSVCSDIAAIGLTKQVLPWLSLQLCLPPARLGLRATPEQEVVLYSLPVVILVRLAVSTQDQRRGIGVGLLQDARRWVR